MYLDNKYFGYNPDTNTHQHQRSKAFKLWQSFFDQIEHYLQNMLIITILWGISVTTKPNAAENEDPLRVKLF